MRWLGGATFERSAIKSFSVATVMLSTGVKLAAIIKIKSASATDEKRHCNEPALDVHIELGARCELESDFDHWKVFATRGSVSFLIKHRPSTIATPSAMHCLARAPDASDDSSSP